MSRRCVSLHLFHETWQVSKYVATTRPSIQRVHYEIAGFIPQIFPNFVLFPVLLLNLEMRSGRIFIVRRHLPQGEK